MSGGFSKWEGTNHQMSECLSSQGLSPLQQNTECYCSTRLASPSRMGSLTDIIPTPSIPSPGEIWLVCTRLSRQPARYSSLTAAAEHPGSFANFPWAPVNTSALFLQCHHCAYLQLRSFHTRPKTVAEISQDFPSHSPVIPNPNLSQRLC